MPLKFKHAVSLEEQINQMPGAYPIPEEVVGDTCVDVGCNQGAFLIYAHPRFKKMFAIEPGLGALKSAISNVEERGINNVNFKHAGVSNEVNKTLLLRHYPDPGGVDRSCDASTEIEEFNWDLGTEYEEAPSITLPEIFTWVGPKIKYLKVDCEGAEYKFLMNQNLENIDYLAMEIHNQLGITKIMELRSYLERYFKLVRERHGNSSAHLEVLYRRRGGL